MAISTSPLSTLLALPGRQAGHVQLISLPPCPPTTLKPTKSVAFRSPIILAHTHPLSSLTCTADGAFLITASERGTLLRVWDTSRGQLVRELRRGVDRAEMWGASFEPPPPPSSSPDTSAGAEPLALAAQAKILGWSDKGTIHVWASATSPGASSGAVKSDRTAPSITHLLSKNLPLPKYFSSTASFAQYRLPRKNPHAFSAVVGAAAGKAGVHSAKLEQGDDEWAERFVVSWIPVQVPVNRGSPARKQSLSGLPAGESGTIPLGRGLGSREERRSFGSDVTSRTATPTLRRNETPTQSRRQAPYTSATPPARQKSVQGSTKPVGRPAVGSTPGAERDPTAQTELDWQLVAITFSGDWYRLRITSAEEDEADDPRQQGRCELVEYRRLGVGGGGW